MNIDLSSSLAQKIGKGTLFLKQIDEESRS
jgi:hypothetical protein